MRVEEVEKVMEVPRSTDPLWNFTLYFATFAVTFASFAVKISREQCIVLLGFVFKDQDP